MQMQMQMQLQLQLPAPDSDAVNSSYEELLSLQERMGGDVSRGLTPAEMIKLAVRPFDASADQDKNCCICCCEFGEQDTLMLLPCGHEFHHECIHTWLRSNRSCPICKQSVGMAPHPA
mmetsp:Transcript_22453/g.48471  ORF Transcript_22453/g.48471 Transcript_22453/m.48471 type:complete len:118 (-) Transcript_22453:275-628(-)